EFVAGKRKDWDLVGRKARASRAPDEAARADDHDAAGRFADGARMLKHSDIPSHDEEASRGGDSRDQLPLRRARQAPGTDREPCAPPRTWRARAASARG